MNKPDRIDWLKPQLMNKNEVNWARIEWMIRRKPRIDGLNAEWNPEMIGEFGLNVCCGGLNAALITAKKESGVSQEE